MSASSLKQDRLTKGAIYAAAGFPEYWIVNLVDGALEVHRTPHPAADAAYGWVYRSVEILRPPATEPWGLREMWIADPDGVQIAVIEVPEGHPLRQR